MRKNFGAKPWTFPQPVFIVAAYDAAVHACLVPRICGLFDPLARWTIKFAKKYLRYKLLILYKLSRRCAFFYVFFVK